MPQELDAFVKDRIRQATLTAFEPNVHCLLQEVFLVMVGNFSQAMICADGTSCVFFGFAEAANISSEA
jgi:hypothetical protein